MFKVFYVYILKCSDNSYYTGITNNLEKRLIEHNSGLNQNCYTFNKRPLELQYYQLFNDPLQAIKFEKQIKGWTRKKKEALIEGDWDKLKELSRSKTTLRQAQGDIPE